MATFNIKSTVISNRDATPKVQTDSYVSGGCNRACEGYIQTNGAADGIGSTYRMLTIPSNARVEAMKFTNDILATGCTISVGVWWPTYIPVGSGLSASLASTVIHTTLFASALNCSAAAADVNILNQSGNNGIASQELTLWQLAGLTADPLIDLDIVAYVAGAVAQQGRIGLKSSYCK
jgi:hypothetical protein